MVQIAHTSTVTAYRTQASRIAEIAETGLIGTAAQGYTPSEGRFDAVAAVSSKEASVSINPIGSAGSVSPTPDSVASKAAGSQPKLTSPTDEVTFSAEAVEALAAESASETPSMRAERLAQIKAEIEAGTYDTDAKFDAAVERMLDDLNAG